MNNQLCNLEQVVRLIEAGKVLLVAGEEELLSQLPKGNWIGGTIPYFITNEGGKTSFNEIFVTELPNSVKNIKIKSYKAKELNDIYTNSFPNGFSVIIIPGMSSIHSDFALKAQSYENFASVPLIGWISGVHLSDLSNKSPKVYEGNTLTVYTNEAVVLHVELDGNKYAELNIINIFKQGNADSIKFLSDGFTAKDAIINGTKQNLADYIESQKLNIRFPLVANYFGAMINTSFNYIDDAKTVHFYAPVFKDIEYKQAENFGDYVNEFMKRLPEDTADSVAFSCNCILNYLYCDLEGKKTGELFGPITFGEIAYMLLNQTFVYLTIKDY